MAAVSWMRDVTHVQSMMLSPTEKRVLGALVAHHEPLAEVRLEHLPAEKELDFFELNGGFAIIHENGVFLMDDWTTADLRLENLQEEFRRVCLLLGEIKRIGKKLKDIASELPGSSNPVPKARPSAVILADLAALRAQLAQAKETHAPHSHRQDVREFRRRLENAWSISAQAEELSKRIVEIEEAFRVGSAVQSQSFLAILTMVGLPLAFGDNLAKAFLPLFNLWLGEDKTLSVLLPKAMFYLLSYILLGMLGYYILKTCQALISKREARQRSVPVPTPIPAAPANKRLPWLILLLAVVAVWGLPVLLQGTADIYQAGVTLAKTLMSEK